MTSFDLSSHLICLVNLKKIHFGGCVNLKKIPNFSRAINLEILDCSNCKSLVELWNEDDHMGFVNLRQIRFSGCVNLRKIINLSGAIKLTLLDCYNCESLVELPCLNHLASLAKLVLYGCSSLKKFPQVPIHFYSLNLSETGIEEVPDSINNLHELRTLLLWKSQVKKVSTKLEFLRELDLSGCPITELLFDSPCNHQHLNMSGSAVKNVSIKLESLRYLNLNGCPMVELLSELPPHLEVLSVNDCKSLEKVSFADQNLNQFCIHDKFLMQFRNCFNLNQESIKNIEANAMLKIGSLAMKWAARYGRVKRPDNSGSLLCCFPGNKISANKFKCQSMNSSLSLKIAPNGGSGSRFLVFAICLVADLAFCNDVLLRYICEYQLTTAGGGNGGGGCESFRSEISHFVLYEQGKYMDYHVFILSSTDMVIEDKNYEEASFKFYIGHFGFRTAGEEYIKVERCGVHVFYVDKKSDTDATEKRVAGNKRSFSHDREEGDGGLKRLK
ncbi:disease resistance-like protein DSC1 [Gossypium arboreum]|uniref:disease resistance-like protein DSC1 n=1 Tax=Gossypium arboreum TaxID=29729 RepID=UPI0022F18A8B|nr:disease resistance-like protein DSC1 [Gossypium arboreum]